MKIIIFISLFLASMLLEAQIPKKANTILIAGNNTQEEYFKQINDLLFENGYGILTSDPSMGTITTTEKSYKKGTIRFTFLVKDQKVILRGQFNINITMNYGGVSSSSGWDDVMYYGMNNSPAMAAWNEMAKIADAIPGAKEYLIK